jgi:hypothetical protein
LSTGLSSFKTYGPVGPGELVGLCWDGFKRKRYEFYEMRDSPHPYNPRQTFTRTFVQAAAGPPRALPGTRVRFTLPPPVRLSLGLPLVVREKRDFA